RQAVPLATAPKRVQPTAGRLPSERIQADEVAGDRKVIEVPLHHASQPLPKVRDRFVTPPEQRFPHLPQLGAQPLGRRPPLYDEAPAPVLPTTDVGEAQERERLRLALPTLPSVLGGEPPEFDQSRLLGVQGQAELLESFPQFSVEPFGVVAVLESH